ncbi:hypothetical protein [Neptuniibacter sp. QD37_11]|uniref:hypothetical protein n=1 Tax=Neptuniibacter sp. QD37_11 TaxID=3398209 RepID=UPI0039F632A3
MVYWSKESYHLRSAMAFSVFSLVGAIAVAVEFSLGRASFIFVGLFLIGSVMGSVSLYRGYKQIIEKRSLHAQREQSAPSVRQSRI